jgi:exonuclease SbcD
VLRGRIEELLADPAHKAAESAYCQVTLTDTERPRAAMDRLRQRFPHTLVLTFEPEGAATSLRDYGTRVRGRADLDICCDFLDHVRGGSPATAAERELLQAALEAGREVERDTESAAPGRGDVGAA